MSGFPARSWSRGLSLLEVLLAGALMLMLLALVAQVLVPSFRLVGQSSLRTGLQQEAKNSLDRIERDLRRSSMYGVTIRPSTGPQDPLVLGINRLASGPFSGTCQWETELVAYCYLPASHTLVQKRCPPGPPTLTFDSLHPLACPPAALLQLAQQTNGTESWLGRNVQKFQASVDTAGSYLLTLQLSERNAAGRDEVFNLQRTLFLRNH